MDISKHHRSGRAPAAGHGASRSARRTPPQLTAPCGPLLERSAQACHDCLGAFLALWDAMISLKAERCILPVFVPPAQGRVPSECLSNVREGWEEEGERRINKWAEKNFGLCERDGTQRGPAFSHPHSVCFSFTTMSLGMGVCV